MKWLKQFPVAKMARGLLGIYVVSLTALVIFAVTVGPFQETFRLWSKASVMETKFKESERAREDLEAERGRLLTTIKNLQADWTSAQETIRALRELTKSPESEQRLVESNQRVEKLTQERAVLITKLNELRQLVQARAGKEPKPQ